MFEGASGFGDEQLKGTPKMVTVEREKLGDQPLLQPEEQSTYREDGKLSSRKRYVDGKLVSKEIFEYDAQGHRTAITTYDAEEKLTRTQSFRRLLDESEEEIDSAGGKTERAEAERERAEQERQHHCDGAHRSPLRSQRAGGQDGSSCDGRN